jgi:uncharacterized lipoprotein YajG
MKKISIAVLFATVLASSVVRAEEHNISLNPVNATQIDRCTSLKGTMPAIEIVGITHKGADESVGVIKKKDMVEKIYVGNDLKQVVQDSVRNTLQKCGYKLEAGANSLKMSVVIDDFFTKAENQGVVGKDKARMSVKLDIQVPNRPNRYNIQYGVEKDGKTAPFLKAKRFEKILNATLVDVMNQIAMSEQLAKTIEAAGKPLVETTTDTTTQIYDESDL